MNLVSIVVGGETYKRVRENAHKAQIGGRSHVRGLDRTEALSEDQLIGQLGEYALAVWAGMPEAYFERRAKINKHPLSGDGGRDLPGLDIDVKTSKMRGVADVTRYHLIVRPREWHPHTAYVLGLVRDPAPPAEVLLVGWEYGGNLDTPDKGVFGFKGEAYTMVAELLRPMYGLPLVTPGLDTARGMD